MTKSTALSATLPSGAKMPLNGFGTWKASSEETKSAVLAAIEAGYRHIDCAAVYLNEKAVGEGLKEAFETGLVKRSDLFITSKVWNSCHARDKVVEACKQSLSDLGLDYLDLYLVHHPFSWEFGGLPITEQNWVQRDEKGNIKWGKNVTLQNTWEGVEDCFHMGLTRDIGVSNYSVMLIMDLLQYCTVRPGVNQCEGHVYNTREQLRAVCEEHGIHFTMYSILGSGKKGPLEDGVVRRIAEEKKGTPAQILCKWGMMKGCSVLAKSSNPGRIGENFAAEEVELSEEDVKALDGLDKGMRVCDMVEYWGFASHA